MSKSVIHIYGASGSGTTTLGKYLSQKLGYFHMDTDKYFWMPTNPPFTTKRDVEARLEMMLGDIASHDKVVISGSIANWGELLIPYFTLAIRLVTPTDVRVKRVHLREQINFGARIEKGGDMYENHMDFLDWLRLYDSADESIRSKAQHDLFDQKLLCTRVILDGEKPLQENLEIIQTYLPKEEIQC